MYLVAAWIEMSTPCSKGLKYSGDAQVLSMTTKAPRRCASSAMAETSCTSKLIEPGDST